MYCRVIEDIKNALANHNAKLVLIYVIDVCRVVVLYVVNVVRNNDGGNFLYLKYTKTKAVTVTTTVHYFKK